jgi:predicted hydrolase (HD superfamily)
LTKIIYATAEQMQEYFKEYVKKHNLLKHMVFNAEVIHASEVVPGEGMLEC